MEIFKSTVGRKLIMALTGVFLVLFVIIHMLGNSSVFLGPNGINAYAAGLHALPPLVWAFRLFMFAIFSLHLYVGITLSLENRASKPQAYAVKKRLRANFASETMFYSGILLLAFIVYHLLQFTFQVTNPSQSASALSDGMGRPDVYRMVVLAFRNVFVAAVYLAALVVLFLHLSHGVQSLFQTLGLNNDKTLPAFEKLGYVVAATILVVYGIIPLVAVAGVWKG